MSVEIKKWNTICVLQFHIICPSPQMDVGLNQHFACMFAIFVAILVLREKTCHRLFQTELHWTALSFEKWREKGEEWVGYGIITPSPPGSTFDALYKRARASGSVAQINLTLSNTCLIFEFCKLPTFLDIKGVQAFFADICADIYNCQKRLGLFCEGPLLIF